MSEKEIEGLLATGSIRRVVRDHHTARMELEAAHQHIRAAEMIQEIDPTLAFTALYDAMRKSITAHMRSSGFRVGSGQGAHAKTVAYARAALDRLDVAETLEEFDALRLLRNQSEYDALFIDPSETAQAHKHAVLLIKAVEDDLEGQPTS